MAKKKCRKTFKEQELKMTADNQPPGQHSVAAAVAPMWQKYPDGQTFGAAVEQSTGPPSVSIAGKPPAHGLSNTGHSSSHSHLVTKLFWKLQVS